VPSIGGGTKLIRTFLDGEGEGVCSGLGEGGADCSDEIKAEGDSPSVGEGVGGGDSCATVAEAAQTIANTIRAWNDVILSEAQGSRRSPLRYLSVASRDVSTSLDMTSNVVSPVHVWKNIVPPFTVAQKLFIEIMCHKLIVQTVEVSKVIDCALSRVFARSPSFH
jgi:hypothetical protein